MAKVWVVERGEYSDRHVYAVCSTEERAREFERALGHSVGEVEIDAEPVPPAGMKSWNVCLDYETGDMCAEYGISEQDSPPDDDRCGASAHYKSGRIQIHTRCWARDRAHAIKIASERRAQLRARGVYGDWGYVCEHPHARPRAIEAGGGTYDTPEFFSAERPVVDRAIACPNCGRDDKTRLWR